MVHVPRHRFSFAEYVLLEQEANVKHEFLDGNVWAMSGGTPEHAGIAATILRLVGTALLGRPCRAFSADLRVRIRQSGLSTYPDVSVVCGSLEIDPADPSGHTVLNPRLIAEVLSPSTEGYDRGEKLEHYKLIDSLREVMLVAHDRHEIEVVRREADGSWSRQIFRDGDAIGLTSIEGELSVSEIYADPLKP